MTIITICGLVGATKPNPDKNIGGFVSKSKEDKAIYDVADELTPHLSLKKQRYTNMFPLLVDTYKENSECKIIAIATPLAQKIQEEVLKLELLSSEQVVFETIEADETKQSTDTYMDIFAKIVHILDDNEEIIIDLSHGYRHLPLLTLIALIANNFKDKQNIRHILFAQEVEKDKHYRIINLNEYLDIATVSFTLATFNENYTIANTSNLRTDRFKQLFETLSDFSEHMLANSLDVLFKKELTKNIIEQIDILSESSAVKPLAELLNTTKLHLRHIEAIGKLEEDKKLFNISKLLYKKGYLLNAITILNEAPPIYAQKNLTKLSLISPDTKKFSQYEVSSAINQYILSGAQNNKILGKALPKYFHCTNYDIFSQLAQLLKDVKKLRNDLAHAGGYGALKDIKQQIAELFSKYEAYTNSDALSNLQLKENIQNTNCLLARDVFENNATVVFKKLFDGIGFGDPFKNDRLETIYTKNTPLPTVWNIPQKLTQEQEKLIEVLFLYKNTNDEEAKMVYKKDFYTAFSL